MKIQVENGELVIEAEWNDEYILLGDISQALDQARKEFRAEQGFWSMSSRKHKLIVPLISKSGE